MLKINKIFDSQTKTVTFAAVLLAGSFLISRILGLIRDRLLAGKFGAGEDLDIYFAAFRIPDFVYGILIMGGLSAVFLPVFAEYFKKDPEQGWRLVSVILNSFLILLIFLCAVLALLTPWLIKFVAPGFSVNQKDLAVSLTRIIFLSPIFLGLSSIFSGVLHYFNRFLAYSIAPILYNLGIIFGILVLVPIFGLMGLAYGVVLGAFSHWAIQIPAARNSGFKYFPSFNFKYSGLLKIFRLMIPRTIGAAAFHINLIVITAIASTIAAGSIAIFNFANNLQHFPISLVGASFALAAFPAISRAWVNGNKEKFLESFSSVFRQILFLIIPISILMFLLRTQIVQLILETGRFGWLETRLTGACLGLFCLGIFAFCFILFLVRVFYSFQDTKTPVVIGLVSMALNIGLCFLLVWFLSFSNAFHGFLINFLSLQGVKNIQVIGLPLALSLSGIFQFSLLLIYLRKKMGDIRLGEIWYSLKKIILASVLMATVIFLILKITAGFLSQIIFAVFAGSLVYFLTVYLLQSPELKTFGSSLLKQFK